VKRLLNHDGVINHEAAINHDGVIPPHDGVIPSGAAFQAKRGISVGPFRPRFFLWLMLFATLLTSGCVSGSRPPRIGSAARDFAVQDSDRKVSLNQFRGQVVILNFWATWCPPCVEELPSMATMQDRMRSKGIVVLGVSIDVDEDAYHRFLKARSVNFLTVRDPEQKVAALYGTTGWPESYIIDREGVLRRKFVGAVDWNSPEVIDFLNKL
jgi:cytochrome c biogenesis protein CcmG, thiol:disulfide interchange protein DsbE